GVQVANGGELRPGSVHGGVDGGLPGYGIPPRHARAAGADHTDVGATQAGLVESAARSDEDEGAPRDAEANVAGEAEEVKAVQGATAPGELRAGLVLGRGESGHRWTF